MRCPHCSVGVRIDIRGQAAYPNCDGDVTPMGIDITYGFCPECNGFIVCVRKGEYRCVDGEGEIVKVEAEEVIYPRLWSRANDVAVPARYRQEFNEANAVLAVSPKASAALSRRILQDVIHSQYNIHLRNLSDEIDDLMQLEGFPSEIADAIDAVRIVGNFAAHPVKSERTGEIADVEPGEAEWLLEVLEDLFESVFVQPKQRESRTTKLNEKLAELGKPPMKTREG